MSLTFRLATLDDADRCNAFFNGLHRTDRSLAAWQWEFLDSSGHVVPYVIAEDGDRVVGTQAALPIPMVAMREQFTSAKSEETLVDPEYRGQGIFESMYDLLFAELDRREVVVVWGFTTAVKPFIRVGFDVPAVARQVVFPLSGRAARAAIDSSHVRASRQGTLLRSAATVATPPLNAVRAVGQRTWAPPTATRNTQWPHEGTHLARREWSPGRRGSRPGRRWLLGGSRCRSC